MFLPHPVIDDDVQVTRATHFEVRAGAGDVTAVVDHLSRAVDEAVSVAEAVQYADGGRRLELACGSTVRLVMQPAHPARSRPAGTWVVTVLVEGRSPSEAEKVLGVARRVPFTGLEMQDLVEQMPLTAGMPTHLRRGSLSGIAPVLTVHHMRDFLVLVEALRALGVPEACMTVLDKGYRYRDRDRVDAHLRAMGVPVWPWQEAAAALRDHVRRARTAGCRGLLIDDGGYTLPVVLDQCPQLAADFVGLVEQTASGIAKLAPYGELPLPVFSVAESRLKAAVEPYGISDAALRNLSALLPEEKWEGQPALVLGFGRIGAQLAEVLRQRRMRVAVHDTSTEAVVTAMERGFETGPDLDALLRRHQPLLVAGSTGTTSLGPKHAAALLRDCYLVSLTSRDREFDVAGLREAAERVEDAGQLGFRCHLPQGVCATVIADGFPINFHHAESLPNKYADLIMAALITGAATLAQEGHGFAAGHNVAQTDAALAASGLLERYYERFGPHHATSGGSGQ